MLDRNGRIVVVAIAILIAVGAFLLLSGGDDEETAAAPTATPAVPSGTATAAPSASTEEATPAASPAEPPILVQNGEVVGGVRDIIVKKGEQVEFSVGSDKADEVHIHGYDIKKDLEAGGVGEFSFKADITGIFEIELEDARLQIANLRVEP